jgi:hypothetical protein
LEVAPVIALLKLALPCACVVWLAVSHVRAWTARCNRLAALHRRRAIELDACALAQRGLPLLGDPAVSERLAAEHRRHAAELSGGLLARLRWHWRHSR